MFEFFSRRARKLSESEPAAPEAVKQVPLSPRDLYEASDKKVAEVPEHTNAEQSQQDQQALRRAEEQPKSRGASEHRERPQRDAPALPVTGNDDAILAMLGGAHFGPAASLTLPSGKTLDAAEAQTWTDLYRK